MSIRFGRRRMAGVATFILAGAIGVSAYAFTASYTVASHSAGAGAATVSGCGWATDGARTARRPRAGRHPVKRSPTAIASRLAKRLNQSGRLITPACIALPRSPVSVSSVPSSS
jgi:hypothetical protein